MTLQVVVPQPEEDALIARRLCEGALQARYGMTQGSLQNSLERSRDKGHLILVAKKDVEIVGLVLADPSGGFGRGAYLKLLLVREDCTRQGIGEHLMNAFEGFCFAGPGFFLLVNSENLLARRFYERRGYSLFGRLPGFVRPSEVELVLHKRRNSS